MRVKVEEKDNKLYVFVEMLTRIYRKNGTNRIIWETPQVLKYLKKNHPNYKIESTLQSAYVSSFQPLHQKGEWIFTLVSGKSKVVSTPPVQIKTPPESSQPDSHPTELSSSLEPTIAKEEKESANIGAPKKRIRKKIVKKIRRIKKSSSKDNT